MEVREPVDRVLPASAILFDLDGVLANSIAMVERAWRIWSERHLLNADEVMAVMHGRRKPEIFKLVAPHLDPDAETAALIGLENELVDLVTPIPGAAEFVASLPPGSWAIGTSGERAVAVPRLQKLGMPIPKVLIAAEDVEYGKPNPAVYLQAAAGIGADPLQSIVFEDAPLGLQAAHAGGIRGIGVLTTYPREALHPAAAWVADFRHVVANIENGRLTAIILKSETLRENHGHAN